MSRFFQTALITRTLVLAAAVSTITMPQRATAQGPTEGLAVRDVFQLSSNIVEVNCFKTSDPRFPAQCSLVLPDGTQAPSPYIVPPKLNFVITSVQINPRLAATNETGNLFLANSARPFSNFREVWFFPSNVTTVYQYPHGIVLSPGFTMSIVVGSAGAFNVSAVFRGYLSPAVVVTGPLPN
jgi:hypothetical protein